jgi:hypothetical protein
MLFSSVDSCAFLVFSAKSLLARHEGRGCGTKSAVFVPPFEKDLLTRFRPDLGFSHFTIHEECEKLSKMSLMYS